MSRHSWRDDGLCGQTDPELFHPPKGKSGNPAKKICRKCSVRVKCLDHALKYNEEGIWGGTTEAERKRMRGKK